MISLWLEYVVAAGGATVVATCAASIRAGPLGREATLWREAGIGGGAPGGSQGAPMGANRSPGIARRQTSWCSYLGTINLVDCSCVGVGGVGG